MKRKLFLLGIMFLLSFSIVSAIDLTTDLVGYYSYDVFSGTITDNSSFSHDLTLTGPTEDATGVLNGGIDCTPNDKATAADNAEYDQTGSIMVCSWLKIDTASDGKYIFLDDGWGIRQETDGSHGGCTAGNKLAFVVVGLGTVCNNAQTFTEDTWEHWCFFKNTTVVTYYKNNVQGDIDAEVNTMNTGASTFNECWDGGTEYADVFLDETAIYSSVHNSYVPFLYNSGVGCNAISDSSGCTQSTPLVVNTDMTGDTNYPISSLFLKYNGSFLGTLERIFNCTLTANNVLNMTDNNVNLTLDQNFTINFGTAVEKDFYLNITCINGDTQINDTSNTYLYRVDTINPTITSVFSNNTVYTRGINTMLNFTAKYFDTNLYAVNTTICKLTGTTCTTVINNTFNTALVPPTKNHTILKAITGFSTGRYFARAIAWDSHTAKIIEDYKIDNVGGLFSDTGVEIEDAITLTSADIDTITMEKSIDRYSYDVELKEPKESITFKLQSTGKLDEIEDSEYLGHFVDFENKKWIDFESEAAQGITYNKISDYEYDVIVDFKKLETSITFNSIGDLNEIKKTWYFNITNSSTIRAKDKITNANIQNITVKVYTYPNTLIQQKSTTNYNISLNITSGTYYINISGNFGGITYITNVSANQTFSQNLNKLVYLSLPNSLYLLLYDEQTEELIDDRNVTIQVINYQNISRVYTTATGSTFQSDFAAGFYEINYLANNYTARSYYTTIAGGDTQTLRLYLLSDLDSTHQYLNYDIVDESAAPISNSTLKMQRYYIGNGTVGEWRTVEMSIANDQGKGFVFAELFDATYRFIVEYPFGTTKKITSQTKLDTRDLFFSISLIDIGLTNFYQSGDVATTLVFSNTTKIWTYSFNGASLEEVEEGRFLVQKFTPQTVTTICNTTVSASSGGMTCNLTAYSNDDSTFMAKGFVTFASDSLEYLVEGASVKITASYLKYGMNGVFWTLVAVGTMALIGVFSPVGSIVLALFGLVLTNMMGLMYFNYAWLVGIIIVGLIYIFSMRRY